jgi:tetratricopeptide (TPR) repeat protein
MFPFQPPGQQAQSAGQQAQQAAQTAAQQAVQQAAQSAQQAQQAAQNAEQARRSAQFARQAGNTSRPDSRARFVRRLADTQPHIVQLNPPAAPPLYQAALDAVSKGDQRAAQRLLRQALAQDPADDLSRRLLGITSFEQGDISECLEVLYPLLVAAPTDVELLTCYGLALSASGRYEDAIKMLSRADGIHSTPQLQASLAQVKSLASSSPPSGAASSFQRDASGPKLLAEELDGPSSSTPASEMRGALKTVWHRRAISYLRFWLGALFVLLAVFGGLAYQPDQGRGDTNNMAIPVGDWLAVLATFGAILCASAVVSGRFTRYTIYEHRLDLKRGVLFQRTNPIWLYDISGVELRRSPLLTLTGTASIDIDHDAAGGKGRRKESSIVATGGIHKMTSYMEQLQGEVVRERRAMKKIWI